MKSDRTVHFDNRTKKREDRNESQAAKAIYYNLTARNWLVDKCFKKNTHFAQKCFLQKTLLSYSDEDDTLIKYSIVGKESA